MPQKTQLLAAEGTLGGLEIELFLPQDCQDLPDVADTLLQRGAVAEKVVQAYDYGAVQGPTSPRYAPNPLAGAADNGAEVPAAAASGT